MPVDALETDQGRRLQYDFDPKKLLGRILRIFVNLWSAPDRKRFAAAVAEDGRSYRPENFTEAAEIAGKVELPGFEPALVPALEALAGGVLQAREDVQADDEVPRRPHLLGTVRYVPLGGSLQPKLKCRGEPPKAQ